MNPAFSTLLILELYMYANCVQILLMSFSFMHSPTTPLKWCRRWASFQPVRLDWAGLDFSGMVTGWVGPKPPTKTGQADKMGPWMQTSSVQHVRLQLASLAAGTV